MHLVPDASEGAAVVEVRTVDRTGLLYALGRALAGQGLSIRSAHISTLAGQAIDTFYVTEADGRCPDAARAHVAVDHAGRSGRRRAADQGGRSDGGQLELVVPRQATSARLMRAARSTHLAEIGVRSHVGCRQMT